MDKMAKLMNNNIINRFFIKKTTTPGKLNKLLFMITDSPVTAGVVEINLRNFKAHFTAPEIHSFSDISYQFFTGEITFFLHI